MRAPVVKRAAATGGIAALAVLATTATSPAAAADGSKVERKVISGASVQCDGGYRFNWHWKDAPYFIEQNMSNATITVLRCWDGQGNLTNGTSAKLVNRPTNWSNGPFSRYEFSDSEFHIKRASPQRYEGYITSTLLSCTDWGCQEKDNVDVTVTIDSFGGMSINTEPPPFEENATYPRFTADNPDTTSSDWTQTAPPPPQQ